MNPLTATGYVGVSGLRKQSGFSLIELLIVIAIILIIAAIAIPNLVRARISANEAAAVQNIRTITTAQVAYLVAYNNGYAPNLGSLGGVPPVTCNGAGLIDPLLAAAQRSGYNFVYIPGAAIPVVPPGCAPGLDSYTVAAVPILVGSTGQRSFCATQTGMIHFDRNGGAIASAAACNALPVM